MLPIFLAIENDEDRAYLNKLFAAERQRMFKIAMSVLHHEEDSWDCVQESFLSLCENPKRFFELTADRQRHFLYACSKNNAINVYNKKKRQIKYEFSISGIEDERDIDILDESMDIEREYLTKENMLYLKGEIDRLKPEMRDALYMRYFYSFPDSKSANLQGITENNFRVRINRAQNKLKKQLKMEGKK